MENRLRHIMMRKITPSAMSPWEGTPVPGSPYTAEQHRMMKRERPSWTHFDARMVKLTYPPATFHDMPIEVSIACPVIAWTKDRARVLVITPGGEKRWMDAKEPTT